MAKLKTRRKKSRERKKSFSSEYSELFRKKHDGRARLETNRETLASVRFCRRWSQSILQKNWKTSWPKEEKKQRRKRSGGKLAKLRRLLLSGTGNSTVQISEIFESKNIPRKRTLISETGKRNEKQREKTLKKCNIYLSAKSEIIEDDLGEFWLNIGKQQFLFFFAAF